MYDVELISGIPGYLYRSASEYYLTDTFTRGPRFNGGEGHTRVEIGLQLAALTSKLTRYYRVRYSVTLQRWASLPIQTSNP